MRLWAVSGRSGEFYCNLIRAGVGYQVSIEQNGDLIVVEQCADLARARVLSECLFSELQRLGFVPARRPQLPK